MSLPQVEQNYHFTLADLLIWHKQACKRDVTLMESMCWAGSVTRILPHERYMDPHVGNQMSVIDSRSCSTLLDLMCLYLFSGVTQSSRRNVESVNQPHSVRWKADSRQWFQTVACRGNLNWHKLDRRPPFEKSQLVRALLLDVLLQEVYKTHNQNSHTFYFTWINDLCFCWTPHLKATIVMYGR